MTRMAVPASTFVLGALGAIFLVKGIWNPTRAVVKKGGVSTCAGPDTLGVCHPTLVINADVGKGVYAVGSGKLVSIGPDWVHIQVANEPVILFYQGLKPMVKEDSHVLRGQKIGVADHRIEFAVWELTDAGLLAVEPASWLAARGYRIAQKFEGDRDLWCEQTRHILVPKAAHQQCKLRNPSAAGFALLPVSIEQE